MRINQILVFAAGLGIAAFGHSAVYYLSPFGDDYAGDGTAAAPWRTLDEALRRGGGNTFVLKDGIYDYQGSEITNPPSGSASAYTVVKAATDGGAVFSRLGSLAIPHTSSYVQFEGIKWSFAGEKQIHGNHLKFLRCAFEGGPSSGNATNTVVGTNDSDDTNTILFEDCWFYGIGGRYDLLVYNSDKVIVRRCVIRHEGGWDDQGSQDPEAGLNFYNSSNCLAENVLVVDSVGAFKTFQGSFYAVKNGSTDRANKNNSWLGCVALVSENMGLRMDVTQAANLTVQDSVFWDCKNGGISFGTGDAACAVNRVTIGRTFVAGQGDFMGGLGYWGSQGARTVKNLVFVNLSGRDLDGVSASYFDTYHNGSSSDGTGRVTVNPFSGGLKYLPRIEDGSALKTAGEGGGQMGAQIVKRYGAAGSLYGDPGYDALTTEDLWPWPNQARIFEDMCRDRTSGFCAAVSLTDYVWNYAGSPRGFFPADTSRGEGDRRDGSDPGNLGPRRKYVAPSRGRGAEFGGEAVEVVVLDSVGNAVYRRETSGGTPIVWDGRDSSGRAVESGVYVCKVKDNAGKDSYYPLVVVK